MTATCSILGPLPTLMPKVTIRPVLKGTVPLSPGESSGHQNIQFSKGRQKKKITKINFR